ncbi:MAG: globin [Bacilli bacterium]
MQSFYEHIGGERTVQQLVDTFYDIVAKDSTLNVLFPEDFTETKRKQTQFLTQFFGGPSLYSDEHGHPMLRRRHMPFPISKNEAIAWLACMQQSVDCLDITDEAKQFMMQRFQATATHMINHGDTNLSSGD